MVRMTYLVIFLRHPGVSQLLTCREGENNARKNIPFSSANHDDFGSHYYCLGCAAPAGTGG